MGTGPATHAFDPTDAMTRFRLCSAILCLAPAALFCEPEQSWAWGGEAHRIIALVADRLLQTGDPPIETKVAEVLAADKSNTWTTTDIAGEAIWADALREKSPEGRVATSKWHYVKLDPDNPDLKKACFGRPALKPMMPASHGPQDDCIVDKIEQFTRELREPSTSEPERLMALQFLLNLVGDIHDPLFAVERNDQSGQLCRGSPAGEQDPGSAQRLLGGRPGRRGGREEPGQGRRADRRQADRSRYPQMVRWHPGGVGAEIVRLAKSVVYGFPAGAGDQFSFPVRKGEADACGRVPVHRLDAGYRERAVAAVKEQLAKAGVRLASLLRDSLQSALVIAGLSPDAT